MIRRCGLMIDLRDRAAITVMFYWRDILSKGNTAQDCGKVRSGWFQTFWLDVSIQCNNGAEDRS